jgi:hypothetical protein
VLVHHKLALQYLFILLGGKKPGLYVSSFGILGEGEHRIARHSLKQADLAKAIDKP